MPKTTKKAAKKTAKKATAKTATKKTTKPAATTEKEVLHYELVSTPEKVRSPQIQAVVSALESLKNPTSAEVAEFIAPKIKTVQTPERIATYYLTELRHKGFVRTAA